MKAGNKLASAGDIVLIEDQMILGQCNKLVDIVCDIVAGELILYSLHSFIVGIIRRALSDRHKAISVWLRFMLHSASQVLCCINND